MNVTDLARVVLECRVAQQEYSRTRSGSAWNDMRKMERKLDRCVAMVLEGQKELFEKDSPPPSGPQEAV